MWQFWRRHRRKILVSAGLCGSGYVLYKLYDASRRRLSELERQLADERENEEHLKTQMQTHFENIQLIANTTTLPHSMHYLSSRVAEELDLLNLTERLMKGKGQPNSLTSSEKLELWDRLKILSFTRMVLSVWAMTMLSLYIRIQVNVLGRHLYIDTACDLEAPQHEEPGLQHRGDGEEQFLASADFLSSHGMPTLISNMQAAATEVLKGNQLKDFFNTSMLHETIVQILDTFMSMGSPHHWVDYLMPENVRSYKSSEPSSTNNPKFDQLMVETRAVLSSAEFGNILDKSLNTVVDAVMEDIKVQCGENNLSAGIPLARLIPRVVQISPLLLEKPSRNKFSQIIQNIPEVEVFFTLLYANMPPTS